MQRYSLWADILLNLRDKAVILLCVQILIIHEGNNHVLPFFLQIVTMFDAKRKSLRNILQKNKGSFTHFSRTSMYIFKKCMEPLIYLKYE